MVGRKFLSKNVLVRDVLKNLSSAQIGGYGKDFLCTWDKDNGQIGVTLMVAQLLKNLYHLGISARIFNSGLAVSIFRDKSTRTKYSFAAAANLLGLAVEDLDEKKSQMAHGETVRETANMLSFLTRVIGIRDDIYLGVGHRYLEEVARSVEWGYGRSVLKQRPSVINLQSDQDHPTQSLSDLLHLINHFGGLEKLRGKKLTMSWAYSPSYGKPLSVPQGVIALMARFGLELTLAYPDGYHLIPEVEADAKKEAKKSGGSFRIINNIKEAFAGAEIVYPKSWAPYQVMQRRTELFKKEDERGLKKLEAVGLAQNARYQGWSATSSLMKLTKNGRALYLHCLPADITGVSCRKGEVEKEVFEKFKEETYRQAGYKPFVIASMILLTQFGDQTPRLLDRFVRRKMPLIDYF